MDKNEYVQEIRKRIRERVEMRYGARRAVFISIATPLILNGIAYYVLYKIWGIDAANQNIVTFFIGTVLAEVAILGCFLWSWRFYDVPEEIYREQKNRLEEIDPKLTKIIVSAEPTGELGKFIRKKIGIYINNKTDNDFSGVLELKEIIMFFINEQCEEFPSNHGVDISSSRFPNLNINGKDHIVIDFAEIRDSIGDEKGSGFVLLTEKTVPLLLTEMLFIRPDGVPEPNFAKARFLIQFEIRGKFDNNTFYRKTYDVSITLRANVLSKSIDNGRVIFGSRKIDSNIEIEGIEIEGVWNDQTQD
jgi:hypothetical protein